MKELLRYFGTTRPPADELLTVALYAGLMAGVQALLPLPSKLIIVPVVGLLVCLLLIFPVLWLKRLSFERRTRLVDRIGFVSLMVENIAILSSLNLSHIYTIGNIVKIFAIAMIGVFFFSAVWIQIFTRLVYPFMQQKDEKMIVRKAD